MSTASYDLCKVIVSCWPQENYDRHLFFIEKLLLDGADINVPFWFYPGGQKTAINSLLHGKCFWSWRATDTQIQNWHKRLEKVLHLFVRYRGFEAFQGVSLRPKCNGCWAVIYRKVAQPLYYRKWLYFCASPVMKRLASTPLFERHLLGVIRLFADDTETANTTTLLYSSAF